MCTTQNSEIIDTIESIKMILMPRQFKSQTSTKGNDNKDLHIKREILSYSNNIYL